MVAHLQVWTLAKHCYVCLLVITDYNGAWEHRCPEHIAGLVLRLCGTGYTFSSMVT